jgi:ABC-type multidrug transport system fused ATPase/permease subunit
LWQKVRAVSAELFGSLEEWLNGTAEIQTSGAGPYILRRLYRLQRRRWRTMVAAMRVNYLLMAWPILIPTLAYVAAYIWGARLFQNETLTIGAVYLIFYYIDTIKSPLYAVRQQMQEMQRAAASLNRIVALFAEQPTMHDGPVATLPPGPLAVAFHEVTFRYEADEAPVLRGVDFHLAPGRTLGLLGRTGSGKTTISRLLFRFYDPTQGEIRLGDGNGEMIPLPRLSQAAIRARVGMVTQDVELFHATVRDNLTLFDEGIEDGRLHAALAELGLDSWLDQLPNGLDTKLEGSDNLSAGEAQLLALARVFLRDPGLVILDEASSRLDPATEYLIERAIERLLHGRTAIIIAHRLTTVARADEIMVLGGGEILEHDERAVLADDPDSHFSRLLQTGVTVKESRELVHE